MCENDPYCPCPTTEATIKRRKIASVKSVLAHTSDVLAEVLRERRSQDAQWGIQNHSLMVYLGILSEEFGEAAKEINELHFREGNVRQARKELLQTAAVAVAMVEMIDRKP